ncbi:MAG: hypothetical protein A3F31_03285 [Candidatus Levybacteria bacterium RIFCSPHIGHO2_12_FULL_38_12]|nr:MAG: hypothetical protein A2770_03710 [Candidatus Levybacteria bacterium RIFCSPHIGHO2_01_FULL_38_12]OGH22124.1 MAG: hypothetical protein A3D75_02655 [Candidatus Levybacteria bacterium RIFCSPHIGHO2_02_FULL_37_18]OGH22972.1 MAG: hypothetical protein A3F31_03285 [Candidatus Levybacteria bacterium RIFCSPHIGHO2_12_FULL_38_12]OGH34142.1 MAG: hypothetical protein A3A47_03415 [Candidatus Levybacteria bacterium RIFCSPLOWO2_01_FULL_37_20]OGH44935.1 MAG: hypothetical protein A3J14_01080 [Candidatus Lev
MAKNNVLLSALDGRQFLQWGEFLKKLGWDVEVIDGRQIYIRRVPLLNHSVIKIQHAVGPMPFAKIDKIAKKYNCVYIVIEPHAYKFNKQDYLKNGYQESFFRFAHTATRRINIASFETEIFKSFSENARRNIKKAKEMGVIVKPVFFKDEKDDSEFRMFYKLLKNLSKMKKFYVPSYDEFHKKWVSFKDNSFLLFGLDPKDKKPVAVVWYGFYKPVISYFQTGINNRGYDLLANYLLVWEGILLGKKLGMKVFDFESVYDPRYPNVNKRWKNYTEFKTRFHGEYLEYPPAYIKFYSPIFKLMYTFSTLFAKKPKAVFHSNINGHILIDKSYGSKTVFSGGPQSGGEFVWMWRRLISQVKSSKLKVKNCLILGVGGGTVIEFLKKYFPDVKITAVEIDPIMVQIAKEHFNLDPKLASKVVISDAVLWVNKKPANRKYDLIIVDLFIGALNPPSSRQGDFLKKLREILNKNGIILYNSQYQEKKPEEFEEFRALCSSFFSQVEQVYGFKKNRVLLINR